MIRHHLTWVLTSRHLALLLIFSQRSSKLQKPSFCCSNHPDTGIGRYGWYHDAVSTPFCRSSGVLQQSDASTTLRLGMLLRNSCRTIFRITISMQNGTPLRRIQTNSSSSIGLGYRPLLALPATKVWKCSNQRYRKHDVSFPMMIRATRSFVGVTDFEPSSSLRLTESN